MRTLPEQEFAVADDDTRKRRGCGCGIGAFGVGSVAAMIISFVLNHSVFWMLVHGFFGWIYVIIYVIRFGF